jgi:Xaa-Pro aminopeptidase
MIKASEYAARRSKLFEKLEEGSAMLIYAGVAKSSSADETYPFEVNRNFYYLTGIDQENSALLLIKSEGEFKEFLFIDPYNPAKEKWYGKKLEVAEARAISGVHNVLLTTALTAKLDTILNDKRMEYGKINVLYLDLEKELKIAEQTSTNDFKNA